MTARADIVARITDRIQFLTGAAPDALAHDRPLIGQRISISVITIFEIAEIENSIEDEFAIGDGTLDDLPVDWSIDKIADAVIAAKKTTTR